jgi:hypothetical protein
MEVVPPESPVPAVHFREIIHPPFGVASRRRIRL